MPDTTSSRRGLSSASSSNLLRVTEENVAEWGLEPRCVLSPPRMEADRSLGPTGLPFCLEVRPQSQPAALGGWRELAQHSRALKCDWVRPPPAAPPAPPASPPLPHLPPPDWKRQTLGPSFQRAWLSWKAGGGEGRLIPSKQLRVSQPAWPGGVLPADRGRTR